MFSKISLVIIVLIACVGYQVSSARIGATEQPRSAITDVQPNWGLPGRSLPVTITGQETHFAQGSSTVWFSRFSSTIYASYVEVWTPTTLRAQFFIPSYAEIGAWDVSVLDRGYGTTTLYGGFAIYPTPEITSIDPDSAKPGSDLWVAISGANTYFGMASSTSVWFEASSPLIHIGASAVNVLDRYNLAARFQIPQNAPVGWLDVTVATDGFPSPSRANGFRIYVAAELTSIAPDIAARNDDLWVTISGSRTHFGDASSTEIWFSHASSDLHAGAINIINSSLLAAHLNVSNSAPLGKWDVWVNDHIDPPLVLSDGFTVFAFCGDVDGSGSFNIADVVYMINYIFGSGPKPKDITGGDVDCTGDMNIADAVYFLSFIFGAGPAPCAACK